MATSALVWDEVEKHFFETGVSQVALAVYNSESKTYGIPVAWNGVTSISESPEGADANPIYADNIKYLNLRGVEEFGFSIEAYTYPDEWAECDGSATVQAGLYVGQQTRKMFGLAFVTQLGNDAEGSDFSEKLHIIYGATASPSERSFETINDSPEAITFSWECDTTPVDMSALGANLKKASLITISKKDFAKYADVKNALFGNGSTPPKFLMPSDIKTIIGA